MNRNFKKGGSTPSAPLEITPGTAGGEKFMGTLPCVLGDHCIVPQMSYDTAQPIYQVINACWHRNGLCLSSTGDILIL